MTSIRYRRILPALVLAGVAQFSAANAPQPNELAMESAMQAYAHCHWQQAFRELASLARAGHPQAARVALLMWRNGPALYGIRFAAADNEVQAWATLAASQPPFTR